MREIKTEEIIKAVKNLCIEANYSTTTDLKDRIKKAFEEEQSDIGKEVLSVIIKNQEMAKKEKMPVCQDTGIAVVFAEIGQDLHITGGIFSEAVNEGVRQGYTEGYLRKSVISDPVFKRLNTNDNTPAIIHTDIVPGNKLSLTVMPKGSGAENMSEVRMLRASDGLKEIKNFVLEKVRGSGGRPCPPIIVGVGVGGNLERCAILSKKALLRETGKPNKDPNWAQLEKELLKDINRLGIGPMGLGGTITALSVHIMIEPCHIASLPVAVNIQCHANRHKTIIL
ncbi:MAG TPA: fumarate hydratase [Clostridiales bacterium]|nr:fumarate hydratase [Clostridiales bacterium]HQP69503.1 fumarate hydratase [Clostridiales bacterium]